MDPPRRRDPVLHINRRHRDELLAVVRVLGGHPDATAAQAAQIDAEGIDVTVEEQQGSFTARIRFAETVDYPDGLKAAFDELTRRAVEQR